MPREVEAQGGSLDVLDGETLYDSGWLFTLGGSYEEQNKALHGTDSVSDPVNRSRTFQETTLAGHYGLRHDLQLSCLLPYVQKTERQHGPGAAGTIHTSGAGDMIAAAKWRFWRWDAPGEALNCGLLTGLKVPTGSSHEDEHGVRVDPELQPGTGSWDPFVSAAATYEPERWRFNTYLLYKRNTEGASDYKHGDEFEMELAAGNRFWLVPYPGPFMRFDLFTRARHEERARQHGDLVHDSGGDALTLGGNLAFRPRPSLDFQLEVEVPVWQRKEGTQLADGVQLTFTIGLRF